MKSKNFINFFFYGLCFQCCIWEGIAKRMLPRFSLLSPRSCRVLHFTLKSVVHFGLIFVKGVMSVYRFIVLHVGVRFLTSFAEKTILSPLNCLCSFVKNQLTVFVKVCFRVLYSVSLIYLFILWLVPHCLDYYS